MSLKVSFLKKRLEAETLALQYIKNSMERKSGVEYKELVKQINSFLSFYFNHQIFKVNNEEDFFKNYDNFKFDMNAFEYDSKAIHKETFGLFLEIRYITDNIKKRLNQQ